MNDVLNERLSNLKEVELEAKKIINLSSDAEPLVVALSKKETSKYQ